MKRIILAFVGVLTVSTGAEAQSTAQMIERALMAAPARGRDAASVVRWKADYTYETIKEGMSQMVCYDGPETRANGRSRCSARFSGTWKESRRIGGSRRRVETRPGGARW